MVNRVFFSKDTSNCKINSVYNDNNSQQIEGNSIIYNS